MLFREDNTYKDLCEKSFEQWLDDMEKHDDLAVRGGDVSGVTDMWGMFEGCVGLVDVSALSGWDVSGVTDMREMFRGRDTLTRVQH